MTISPSRRLIGALAATALAATGMFTLTVAPAQAAPTLSWSTAGTVPVSGGSNVVALGSTDDTFMVVASNGAVFRSGTGAAWIQVGTLTGGTPPDAGYKANIAFGLSGAPQGSDPGAVGTPTWVVTARDCGCIWTSTDDGATWTLTASGGGELKKLAYGDGHFLVGYQGNTFKTSTTGLTWYAAGSITGLNQNAEGGMAFGNNTFVIPVAYTNNVCRRSTTGTWTNVGTYDCTATHSDNGSNQYWGNIAFGNNTFVGPLNGQDDINPAFWVSTDNGATWTSPTSFTGRANGITFGGGYFVIDRADGTTAYSTDGMTWTGTGARPGGGSGMLAYGNGTFLGVGGPNNATVSVAPMFADSFTFTNKTSSNTGTPGLGNNTVYGVYAIGSTVYAATFNGLSISADGGATFTNKTTSNGLGSNTVNGVYATDDTIYAATAYGLAISTDGGATFDNKTSSNTGSPGLGNNFVKGVYAIDGTIYAATDGGGLAISTNGGATFTNKTQADDSLGSNYVLGVYVVDGTPRDTVYAATTGGLSISTDGGTTFTNRTTSNGLGDNYVWGVYVSGSTIYAATDGSGLSISTDGGTTFTTKTKASNGLGNNYVKGVYVSDSTIYAATWAGLSISTNGGTTFTNYTTASTSGGLGSNNVQGVFAIGSTVYAATNGGGLSIGSSAMPPGVLTGVAAAAGVGTAAVSWTVDDTGGSAVTRIEFALDDIVTVDDSTTNVAGPHTLTGLVNGQTYTVYARAVNTNGAGPWSAGTPVTPQAPPAPVPPRPAPAMAPTSQTIAGTAGTPITATSTFTLENFTLIPRYTVYPALPAGLTIDSATGVVTGTPTEAYPSTRHWITATAGGNSETASSTLQVSIDPAPTPPPAPTPTITIVGTRSANGARIEVTGTSTHLAGTTLTPWFQLTGRTSYMAGKTPVTVASDGTFTWSRKANKKTYVYFTHNTTESNTITIAAR